MRKFVSALLVLLCGMAAAASLHAQIESYSLGTLKVFVAPLQGSDADLAKSVTGKLSDRLASSGITLVGSGEEADAILSGTGLVRVTRSSRIGHLLSIRVHADMRLVKRNGVALLAEDISSDRTAVNEASSFVENAAKKVAAAVAEEMKRKSSEPAAQK
jgi:hypothetical protein